MRKCNIWLLTLLAGLILIVPAGSQARSLEEFISEFSQLSGEEEHADAILAMSEAALAEDAGDDPRFRSTALAYRSHAFWLKKDLAAAEAAALQAIEADPTSALAYFIHTDVLYELQRPDEARDACLKATALMEYPEYRDTMRGMCENSYAMRAAARSGLEDRPGAPD